MPAAVPCIVFPSGGQHARLATAHLNGGIAKRRWSTAPPRLARRL